MHVQPLNSSFQLILDDTNTQQQFEIPFNKRRIFLLISIPQCKLFVSQFDLNAFKILQCLQLYFTLRFVDRPVIFLRWDGSRKSF